MNTRVRFEPSGIEVRVAAGERVLDVADDHPGAGLPLACRSGQCGACLVAVHAGGEALRAPSAHERETLATLGAEPGERLACQLEVGSAPGAARVVLAVLSRGSRDPRQGEQLSSAKR